MRLGRLQDAVSLTLCDCRLGGLGPESSLADRYRGSDGHGACYATIGPRPPGHDLSALLDHQPGPFMNAALANAALASDVAGAQTLDIMASAPRYNAWQYEAIAPYIGSRVLEVGSGIGNMSLHLVDGRRELVLLTDTDEWYREQLRTRFGTRPNVVVDSLTLPDDQAPLGFAQHRLDTVVALNVVEHIPDHVGALRTMGGMVSRGGRVVVLV